MTDETYTRFVGGREVNVTITTCDGCGTRWRVDWFQVPGFRDKEDVDCPKCHTHIGRFENESIREYRGEDI